MPNVGLATIVTNSAAGRTRSTTTSLAPSSAVSPTSSALPSPEMYSREPSTSSISVASGDGASGSMTRSQLRTTSAARNGVPSLNVRPGRSRKTIRRPPSSIRHDSARAGRSSSDSSKVVSVSKNWAVSAALPAVPGRGRVQARRGAETDPRRAVGRPRPASGKNTRRRTGRRAGRSGAASAGVYGRCAAGPVAPGRPPTRPARGRRCAGQEMRPHRTTPPGERCLHREASAAITTHPGRR